ncbi:hypothetical protein FOL47_006459 [Perkinsus chesapeaki]|uniref:NIF system FeS cluster assembly NifU C-terminal domain-containing protein n=1 Tax=Perkinsus chesapeaki TaxID=330153 RepID=A0A7J6MXM6_PERCH|nr:hypothetical protein FOL47_006459 [Perkinsus chesapeaki]
MPYQAKAREGRRSFKRRSLSLVLLLGVLYCLSTLVAIFPNGYQLVLPSIDQVDRALDAVRPGLAMDGGGVRVLGVTNDGKVRVLFTGACSSCALSETSTKYGLWDVLSREFPALTSIEAVSAVDAASESGPLTVGELESAVREIRGEIEDIGGRLVVKSVSPTRVLLALTLPNRVVPILNTVQGRVRASLGRPEVDVQVQWGNR